MYRIRLATGEESVFNSFEELSFGIISGIIASDSEIYHARAGKWLPVRVHPDYKRAAAQAPSPDSTTQAPAPAPEPELAPPPVAEEQDEGGLDLMTLLDLEELTTFDPRKVQESASAQDTAETADIPAEQGPSERESDDFLLSDVLDDSAGEDDLATQALDAVLEHPELAGPDADNPDGSPGEENEDPTGSIGRAGPDVAAAADGNDVSADATDQPGDTSAGTDDDMGDADPEDSDDLADPPVAELEGLAGEDPVAAVDEPEVTEDLASESADEESGDSEDGLSPEQSRDVVDTGEPSGEPPSVADLVLAPVDEAPSPSEAADLIPSGALAPESEWADGPSLSAEFPGSRRKPVVIVATVVGLAVIAGIIWALVGSGSSGGTAAADPGSGATPASLSHQVSGSQAPAPAVPTAEDSATAAAEARRSYEEAYSRARVRLDDDFTRARFHRVFAATQFSSEDDMASARAAVAGARRAVGGYHDREAAIEQAHAGADPSLRESRPNAELSDDILASGDSLYGLLLENLAVFSIRNGSILFTDRQVESEYTRLAGEIDRLLTLAPKLADSAQAATASRVVAAIGNTRPPPLNTIAPPPRLPDVVTDPAVLSP